MPTITSFGADFEVQGFVFSDLVYPEVCLLPKLFVQPGYLETQGSHITDADILFKNNFQKLVVAFFSITQYVKQLELFCFQQRMDILPLLSSFFPLKQF